MRTLTLVGVLTAITASAGCTAKSTQKGLTGEEWCYEMGRSALVDGTPELAAHTVASIVFGSAPPGGPPPVGTLCADAGWRLWLANFDRSNPIFKNLRWVPSPLDAPDPDLRMKWERTTVR